MQIFETPVTVEIFLELVSFFVHIGVFKTTRVMNSIENIEILIILVSYFE
jgi:hypothetical protein